MAVERRSEKNRRSGASGSFSMAPPQIDVFWLVVYLALIGACAIVMAVSPPLRAAGFIALIVTLAMMPVGLRSAGTRRSDSGGGSPDQLDRLARSIESMTQEAGLSEAAKRVLHRREERELLRREIERDIADEDWDAAMVLVKELAERFGYRADAEEFRTRIERVRAETLDRNVTHAIAGLDGLLRERRWTDAYAEAGRISRLYPESHRVEGLRLRIDEARRLYKIDLERRFLMAAQREDIDTAMQLLKELDSYLTEAEAEPFREVARGVIGKARDNLGVRFKLALQDRNWVGAMEVGERIMREFPNTRMAEEVRGMLDTLRARTSAMSGGPVGASGGRA